MPDAGDVWLDLEGHPFYETARGLEYLFGWCYRDESGEVVYRGRSGRRDRDGERRAFERFVDWVVERRRRYPALHVYHYAAYERTALTRLMGEHGTREQEVDALLRGEVLVDLYRVVKQALQASVESYSIKAVEKLYGFVRTAEVAGGDESTVLFEKWLETGDDALLDDVERYNEEDCRSTVELHEWLLSCGPRGLPWRRRRSSGSGPRRPRSATPSGRRCEARLLEGAEEGSPRRLLGHLLDYHQRESEAAVVGVVPLAAARRGGADRGHATRSAGSTWAVDARGRGQEPRVYTVRPSPRRSTRSRRRFGRTRDREDVHGQRSTTSTASSRSGGRRTVPTSRCRARSFPGQPIHDKEQREALSRLRPRVPRRRRGRSRR